MIVKMLNFYTYKINKTRGNNKMNKQEFISAIAKQADISKAQAEKTLAATIDVIKDTLKKNDELVLMGFGAFRVKTRPAMQGRNPSTGEAIKIPSTKLPYFRPGSQLKDIVKSSKVSKSSKKK